MGMKLKGFCFHGSISQGPWGAATENPDLGVDLVPKIRDTRLSCIQEIEGRDFPEVDSSALSGAEVERCDMT